MLQPNKIIYGFDDVSSDTWFDSVGSGEHRLTRLTADSLNLIPSRAKLEGDPIFFSQRLGNIYIEILSSLKTFTNDMLETLFE